VNYRVLTISREYGSGGAQIAKLIAQRIGWELLDSALVDTVARAAQVDIGFARENDERSDSWFDRLKKGTIRAAAAVAVAPTRDIGLFDPETMAVLTRDVIENAYIQGNCVIVGRGAQCILACRPDVFRVFIDGSESERLRRVHSRLRQGTDAKSLMHSIDEERARYIERFYGRYWGDPHLYNLMLLSDPGEQETAATIVYAMAGNDKTSLGRELEG
jgi:cytidylate kinase